MQVTMAIFLLDIISALIYVGARLGIKMEVDE